MAEAQFAEKCCTTQMVTAQFSICSYCCNSQERIHRLFLLGVEVELEVEQLLTAPTLRSLKMC